MRFTLADISQGSPGSGDGKAALHETRTLAARKKCIIVPWYYQVVTTSACFVRTRGVSSRHLTCTGGFQTPVPSVVCVVVWDTRRRNPPARPESSGCLRWASETSITRP